MNGPTLLAMLPEKNTSSSSNDIRENIQTLFILPKLCNTIKIYAVQ